MSEFQTIKGFIRDTTDYIIDMVSLASNEKVFQNNGLTIAVAGGDYIEIKMVNPTWGTRSFGVTMGGYIYVE